jgi:ribosomal protein L40E
LDFFKNDNDNQSNKSNTTSSNQKLFNSKQRKVLTKTEMMDKYMNYVDTRYISDKNKEDDIEICRKCNAQKYFVNAEGVMICQKCGAQEYILIDCDKPSYKEPPKEIAYFAYKRINHFNIWSGTAGVYCLMVWTII